MTRRGAGEGTMGIGEARRSIPRRPGFSAVEIVVTLALVAAVLVPIVTQSHMQRREAYFLEYHLTAQRRAQALMAVVLTQDLLPLESRLSRSTAGLREIPLPAALHPENLADLDYRPWPRGAPGSSPGQPPARHRLFRDEAFLERISIGPFFDGDPLMFRVKARVSWTFPGDSAGREHHYQVARLLRRPGLSHIVLPTLPAGGAPQ